MTGRRQRAQVVAALIRWIRQIVPSLLLLSLSGCTIAIPDSSDVSALASYQMLKAGTPVCVVLRIGAIANGIEQPSDAVLEQEGTLAWITKDTVCVTSVRDGQPVKILYAGRMVKEIRVGGKEPSQPPEPTHGARS